MTTMEKLPVEVLSEIFIRLLAKHLAQMRSICKPWNALLSDPFFIKSHLHRSIQNNDYILLFSDFLFSFEHNPTPFRARLSRSPDLKLTNLIKSPVIPQIKKGCGAVIGSVNGLICFVYEPSCDSVVAYIWNPSLSTILSLPSSSLTSGQFHFGFGFDPKSDDYKVLKITSFSRAPNKVKKAEVYSMRKGSWKLISPQTFPSHVTIPGWCDNQVCVDDNLHWLCETDLDPEQETILAFDLGAETFCEMPLPETIQDFKLYECLNVLGVLGGKLCVMSRVINGKWVMWVMDEYGVPESWVKHHIFSQFSGDISPYGFTSHGDLLFQVEVNDDHFVLFDPVAAKTKNFKITSKNSYKMKFVEYVDSLVWVAPPKREIKVERESRKRKQDIGGTVKRSKWKEKERHNF